MNSIILTEIMNYYNKPPYYLMDGYTSIHDDRIGKIISFKLFQENNEIKVEFKQAHQILPFVSSKHYITTIKSFDDFKTKWNDYYNYYY